LQHTRIHTRTHTQTHTHTHTHAHTQKHFMAGGLQLNALSGGYAIGTDRMKGLIDWHGSLMLLAWALLLPLGGMLPRHRSAGVGLG